MKLHLITLFFFLSTQFIIAQNTIQRIEPPNWWIGMKHHTIQLLVYGEKVADLTPKIDYPNIHLQQVSQLQNPNYLFLTIDIGEKAKAGSVKIDFYKNDNIAESHNFDLLQRTAGRANIEGFNSSDAIYLITPDRFANGNTDNDNMDGLKEKANRDFKGGRHGGDIAGIEQNLDYIKDLGFTAIWLNPLLENDMAEYSYHGYSTTDFYKVDPRFGSNEAYQKMAEQASSKGLKLIMDMIVNHCGSEHWWMKDLPSDDWINQWETYTQTNHRKTVLQDPHVAAIDKKVFADGWFVPTMPDLNQRNPFMATYLTQNGIWWVEYLGLSGIRMDTYPYPDMDYMADWVNALMKEYPNFNIVGEEWYETPAIVSYWQKDKKNPNGYESNLKSVMDFPLQTAMVNALKNEETFKTGLIQIYETLGHDFLYSHPNDLVIFPDNHDMSRIFTQLNEDFDLFKQAMAFTLTMRGVPQIYYGTEILMTNPGTDDHGIIRSDFPGGWKGDKTDVFKEKGLTDQQKAAKQYLTQLLQWRKTATAVHNGKLMHFIPQDGIYVYFRYNDNQKIMVVMNKNEKATSLELKRFAEMLEGETQGKEVLTSKVYPLKEKLEVPANSTLILEIE
ncbi:MAG: glycoside hydrolase family 13 protein [Chitinophagales bacterium]